MNCFVTKEEYEKLPKELQKELKIGNNDMLLYQIIVDAGGAASVDKLLVEYYRRTGKIVKRTQMVSMMYRLRLRFENIYTNKKQKGVYFLKDK